jgi:hypothetical protein
VESAPTELALPATDDEGGEDAVAGLDAPHVLADLLDDSYRLVADPRGVSRSLCPRYGYRSDPQITVCVTRTSASPEFSIFGRGTSSTRTSSGP